MKYETREGAAWLILDSPETANALTYDSIEEMCERLKDAEEKKAAVLTGKGEHFCSGAHLDTLASIKNEEKAREYADALVTLLEQIECLNVPVVAGINGDAYGAGFEIVVACDLAVAVRNSQFAMPETQMGVAAPLTVERVAETAGRKRVMELALTCEPIDAPKAERWGILNRAVPSGALEDTIENYVSCIRTSEKQATRITKERSVSGRGEYDEIRERMTERLTDPETRERFREAAEGG